VSAAASAASCRRGKLPAIPGAERLLITTYYKMSSLPILLPASVIPKPSPSLYHEWKPQKYLSEPQPPPQDDGKVIEQEMANARQMLDGKIMKKTRPRRTVDYNGTLGRWALVSSIPVVAFNNPDRMKLRKLRPNPGYVPHLRPSPSFIIDVRVMVGLLHVGLEF
jgi:polyadenylation factor subunit 2